MSNLPKGWEEEQLKNIVYKNRAITYGIVQPGGDISPLGIPLIRGKDYSSGKVNLTGLYHVSEEIDRPYSRSKVKENDILLTIVGYVGQTAIVPKELENANITQTTARISVNHEIANYQFVDYFLNSNLGQKNLKRYEKGSAQAGLNLKDIEKVKIFLPPLEEQKKIADILSTVDKKIAFVEENINATEELKKGLMQKLLTEGIGHTEFKDSELGRIPESWEVFELKEIVEDLIGGVSVNSEDRLKNNEEFGILKTSSISNGKFFPQFHKTILDSEISRAIINPKKDHILFSRMNTPDLVGESGYVDNDYFDLFLPDRLWQMNVKDKNKTNVKWLSFILVSNEIKKKIKNAATGTSNSMKNISKPNLLKIIIPFPLIEEQKQIAEILSTVDNKLENLKEKKQSFEELKKGLMQKLLTGEVRV